jgi:IPT/TIG domain/Purple acid Phosphatase, N-terminal domain/Fibronectin type III domain
MLKLKGAGRIFLTPMTVLFLVLLMPMSSLAGSLLISWDAVQDSRLAGYKIKYGTSSGSYSQSVDVGKVSSFVLQGLTEGMTYYLVVVGYDSNKLEGLPSAQISGTVLASSNVASSAVTSTSAKILWKTNKLSDSQVEYGTTMSYGSATVVNSALVLDHSQTLSGLQPSTTYHYRVRSKDQGGSITLSANYTLKTSAGPSITSISPNRGTVGTTIVVSGTSFGSTQGTSSVKFNGTAAMVSSWSASSITVVTPANATSGSVIVTVNGIQSNGVYFKVGSKMGPPGKLRLIN